MWDLLGVESLEGLHTALGNLVVYRYQFGVAPIRMFHPRVAVHLESHLQSPGSVMLELNEDLEDMFACIDQNEGERLSVICRGIVWKFLAQGLPINDWDFIVNEARKVLSPYAGIESEAQANLAFRSQISILD
jgi:hypothetical protein